MAKLASARSPATDGVPPGAVVVAGFVEVEREERGILVGLVAGPGLERPPDAAVNLPPSLERQSFVGSRADEVVTERECLAVGRYDELAEVRPPFGVPCLGNLVVEDLAQQGEIECRPDDGGISKQHPVCRLECVDPRRQEALDRLRKLVEGGTLLGGEDKLPDEERVAARPRGKRLGRVDGKREVGCHGDRELLGGGPAERLELDPGQVVSGGRDRVDPGSGRHADEPRPHGRLCEQVREEEARRVVEPVPVLDHEQRRHHQDPLQECRGGPVELPAARGRIERRCLRGRVDLGVEGNREQRQPRREVGHHPGHERLQHRAGLGRGAVGRDADELTQRCPDRRKGLRRRVVLRGSVELLEAEGQRAQLVDEP